MTNTLKNTEEYLEIFRTQSDPVSEGVLRDLIKLGKDAVMPLINALKDEDEAVKYYSILALHEIRDIRASKALYDTLDDDDVDTWQAAAFAIIHMGEETAYDFISLLQDSSSSWKMRSSAAFILGKTRNKKAVEALSSALDDNFEEVRTYAAYALGEIAEIKTIPALLKALSDTCEIVRVNIIKALGKVGDEKVLSVLKELERNERSEIVRKTLKIAITDIQHRFMQNLESNF